MCEKSSVPTSAVPSSTGSQRRYTWEEKEKWPAPVICEVQSIEEQSSPEPFIPFRGPTALALGLGLKDYIGRVDYTRPETHIIASTSKNEVPALPPRSAFIHQPFYCPSCALYTDHVMRRNANPADMRITCSVCYAHHEIVDEVSPYDHSSVATVKSVGVSFRKVISRLFSRMIQDEEEEIKLPKLVEYSSPDFADLLDLKSADIPPLSSNTPRIPRSKTKRAFIAIGHFLEQFIV